MQLALEDIETSLADRDAEDGGQPNSTADKPADQHNKRRINRGALPAHLPRVHVTIEPDSTLCPCCHGQMHVIGEDSSQRLDRIPAQSNAVAIISYEEKPDIQAIAMTAPDLPPELGVHATFAREHDSYQRRAGTMSSAPRFSGRNDARAAAPLRQLRSRSGTVDQST
jgi:hypothetical protein